MKNPMVGIAVVNSLCSWMKQQICLIYVGDCCCRATLWNSVMLAAAVPASPTKTMIMENLSQCAPVSQTVILTMKNMSWSNLLDKGPLPQTAKHGAALANAKQHKGTTSISAVKRNKGNASHPPSWCCPVTAWRKVTPSLQRPLSGLDGRQYWQPAVSLHFQAMICKAELLSRAAADGKLEILIPKQPTTMFVLRWNEDVAQLELMLWLTLDV